MRRLRMSRLIWIYAVWHSFFFFFFFFGDKLQEMSEPVFKGKIKNIIKCRLLNEPRWPSLPFWPIILTFTILLAHSADDIWWYFLFFPWKQALTFLAICLQKKKKKKKKKNNNNKKKATLCMKCQSLLSGKIKIISSIHRQLNKCYSFCYDV